MPIHGSFPGVSKFSLFTAKELSDKMRVEYMKRIRLAAEDTKNHIVRNLRAHSTRKEGPSAVGEYPHYDSGRLSQSIFTDFDDDRLIGYIICGVEYGLDLEEGGRPFLVRGLFEQRARINQIMAAKLPPGDRPTLGLG